MPIAPPTDGPPPSPATDPAAAQETGQGQAQAIQGLAPPMAMQGPDLSGVNKMFQAIKEALLLLAQSVPTQAAGLQQIISMVDGEAAKFGTSNGSIPGAMGQVTTQAGSQFPGGGMSHGKSF